MRSRLRMATWMVLPLLTLVATLLLIVRPQPQLQAWNPRPASFHFGPVPGRVSQTLGFPGGPLTTIEIWARADANTPLAVQVHVYRPDQAEPIRSVALAVKPGPILRPVTVAVAPIELPAIPDLRVEFVVPPGVQGDLFLGATRDDQVPSGRLTDVRGEVAAGIDLAFVLWGDAGPVGRLTRLVGRAPIYSAVGLLVSLLAGFVLAAVAYRDVSSVRWGPLLAVAIGASGMLVTLLFGLLGAPVTLV